MTSPSSQKRRINPAILILALLLVAAITYIFIQQQKHTAQPDPLSPPPADATGTVIPSTDSHHRSLADLGTPPDWSTLDIWQETITHDDFLHLLTEVYTVDDTWKRYIKINADHAIIRTDAHNPDATYQLHFSHVLSEASPQRNWRSAGELTPGTQEKPLAGVHIAIDPGHIGGEFAKMEQRWFKIGDNPPVKEGELTLTTAKIIKKQLIALGAKVYLVRGENKPVNPHRPDDYRDAAIAKARSLGRTDEETITFYQKKFFYLTGEIRARARRVNLAFRPDLVLCLHYNAEPWDNPNNPKLTDNNHYHVLLHGALKSDEIAHDDERFEMLVKILQRTHDEEKPLGIYMAHALSLVTGLPAYNYTTPSSYAVRIKEVPGVWARNLLANRIYQCPVIYLEPYVMNNKEVHDRIQLGDYPGTKLINRVPKKSIFREYADAVTLALKEYYLENRIIYHPENQ